MKDVAAVAGCSVMTVSRCLRDDRNQSASTRERIKSIAHKIGYQPNPLVSALIQGRRQADRRGATLALINPSRNAQLFKTSPRDAQFLEGVRSRAESMGYRLDSFNCPPGSPAQRQLVRVLRARGIRGAIFHLFIDADARFDLDLQDLATVSVGYSLVEPALNRVVPALYENTLLAVNALIKAGYTRIGLVERRATDLRTGRRFRAAVAVDAADGRIQLVPDLLVENSDTQSIARQINAWNAKHRPAAVISSEKALLDCIKAPLRTGPARVCLNLPPDEVSFPGIDQNWRRIGEKCVEVLSAHLMRNEYGVPAIRSETVVPGFWSGLLLTAKSPPSISA